ncbi:multidrug efflux SMR transporter [Microbacterium sp.]|uniref:DMT family transporter n=1 Tax=Microbacterium sp. TaxID=51671 RepID=UPI0035646790
MTDGISSAVRAKQWAALGAAIIVEVAATLSLKAAIVTPGWYVVVVAGYVSAFVLLALCLRLGMQIGVAYGVWGAFGVAATALLAAAVFGEPLTPLMLVGIALISGGVLLVESGSQQARGSDQAVGV